MKAELRDDATQLVDARQGGMRTQLDPTSNPTQASTPNDARSEVDSMLVELGISHEGATPRERREAIRVFQQARHLPETGVVDTGTRRELEDSLRMRQSMLRNAAAAGEGGPIGDAAATLHEAQSLAMVRFAAPATTTLRAIAQPGTARALGRNLGRKGTSELMNRAARLQATLDDTPSTPRTTALRRAALTSLMAIYDEVDRRVTNAPVNERGLPQLPGVEWDECSPLAGATLDLDPFSRRDEWAAELGLAPQPGPRSHVRRDPDPVPTREPTPAPEPPARTGVPTDAAVDAQGVVDELEGSEGGFMPEWGAPVGNLVLRGAAELVSDVIAPIGGVILNGATLVDAWMLADENHEAMGRALGATLGLAAATLYPGPMRAAIRDGQLSARELERIVQANQELGYDLVQQLGQAGTGIHAAEDALPEGFGLAADLVNQALDAMRARLDQEGIEDPVVREELMLRAANEAATIALGPVGARLAEIRVAITPRE